MGSHKDETGKYMGKNGRALKNEAPASSDKGSWMFSSGMLFLFETDFVCFVLFCFLKLWTCPVAW